MGIDDDEPTTTQLDTHANMVVVGSQALFLDSLGGDVTCVHSQVIAPS